MRVSDEAVEAAAQVIYMDWAARPDLSMYPPGVVSWDKAQEAEREFCRETASNALRAAAQEGQ